MGGKYLERNLETEEKNAVIYRETDLPVDLMLLTLTCVQGPEIPEFLHLGQ